MSLTAMTRESAQLEASIESNQAPMPIGIELSDPAEFESLSPTLSGQPTLLGSREWRE